jgi:hypothetical protein
VIFLTGYEAEMDKGPAGGKSPLLAVLRGFAISLPQLLILLDLGARADLLFGFNNTDTGLTVLLTLLLLAPAVNLVWLTVEVIISVRRRKGARSFLMPLLALLFLLEALLIDIYMLSHAGM